MDTRLSIRGIFQARVLEWVAISFSRDSSQPRDRTQVFHIAGGFFTSWATREAHTSRGLSKSLASLHIPHQVLWDVFGKSRKERTLNSLFQPSALVVQSCPTLCDLTDYSPPGRQEFWSGLPFPSPGDLPHPGIEPGSPKLRAYSLLSEPPRKPNKK